MAYNHKKEEKKFKEELTKNERLYRENGMTDEQISAIREFDESVFRNNRAFYRRSSLFSEAPIISKGTLIDYSDTYLEEHWIELIDSDEKYYRLKKVSPIMRKAFYMYKVLGMYQGEISSKLSIPQRTISYWIVKIAEILK